VTESDQTTGIDASLDIGEYCRQVEGHLTRVNGGHLVRIVGPAFDLVRRWAEDGVPLRVVFHAIDAKAERHRAGHARRPLRIEFCEADVRGAYERWRRAVGVPFVPVGSPTEGAAVSHDEHRRPSLSRHLDRAIERLGRAAGRIDLPVELREAIATHLTSLTAIREEARTLRGSARQPLSDRLVALDRSLIEAARTAAPAILLEQLRRDALQDLAPYRGRLSTEAWQHAVGVTVDRLLREHFGLPVVEI
jgi:hypothetical protein